MRLLLIAALATLIAACTAQPSARSTSTPAPLVITVERIYDAYQENEARANDTYKEIKLCLLYTSPSPRDRTRSRMPSSA